MTDELEDLYGSIMTGDQLDFGDEVEPAKVVSVNISAPAVAAPARQSIDVEGNNCLYISELSWWTTEEDLRDALEGRIIPTRVIFLDSKYNGKSRGIAIVEFPDVATCQEAYTLLSSRSINDVQPKISYAKSSAIPAEETKIFASWKQRPSTADTVVSSFSAVEAKHKEKAGRTVAEDFRVDRRESERKRDRKRSLESDRRERERERERQRERERERAREIEREKERERQRERERERQREKEQERERQREKERERERGIAREEELRKEKDRLKERERGRDGHSRSEPRESKSFSTSSSSTKRRGVNELAEVSRRSSHSRESHSPPVKIRKPFEVDEDDTNGLAPNNYTDDNTTTDARQVIRIVSSSSSKRKK